MISEIQFKNFRALRDTVLPLSRFTLLVGPNGSGKSSVFRAIKLIRDGNEGPLKNFRSIGSASPVELTTILEVAGDRKPTSLKEREGRVATAQHNSIFSSAAIYSLDSREIMKPVQLQPVMELAETGGQLAGVLERLRDERPEKFEELNQALMEWIPEFDRILFSVPASGQKGLLLRTKIGHHLIAASNLSDGTLIALTILTLGYLPNPPSLIGLEEPDRGLHPRLLQDVKNAIFRLCYPEEFGEKREPVQVIATTHNPFFLDLFRDNPDQIVIAEKTGLETKFKRLSDHPNLNEIIAGVPLGEVWYSGVLGGVPAGT